MTQATPSDPVARRWSWRDILLIASLAVNLVVMGIVAAQYLRKERAVRLMGPAYNELLPRGFFTALPSPRRDEVMLILRDGRRDFREQRRELRASAARVADALSAEPFDEAALRKAVDDYGNEVKDLVGQGTGFALRVFADLSSDERKALAARLRERAR